jgi:hypothetical protein
MGVANTNNTNADGVFSIGNCARCGEAHVDVTYHRFFNPPPRYTHWAVCPKTAEPILVLFVEENVGE